MPSSPKIKKEDMLQAALELVSKNGYAALNIKAVAKELGCSTAPISWQFGGMDGLREELIPFAEQYVEDQYYSRDENEFATFEQRGKGTIDLASENPNLFRFLYMGERSQLLSTGFELQTNNQDAANVYQEMAELLGVTPKQVMDFAMTMMVYTQGIGTLIASGIVKDTKENTALKGKFILQPTNLEDSHFFTFLIKLGKLSTLDDYTDSSMKKMCINLCFPLGRPHLLC